MLLNCLIFKERLLPPDVQMFSFLLPEVWGGLCAQFGVVSTGMPAQLSFGAHSHPGLSARRAREGRSVSAWEQHVLCGSVCSLVTINILLQDVMSPSSVGICVSNEDNELCYLVNWSRELLFSVLPR